MDEPWYSVRCMFKHRRKKDMNKHFLYEERITLWKADSADDAIMRAEKEAAVYAEENDCTFIGLSQLYHLFCEKIETGSEVFSLMREHDDSPSKYIDRYFDTGFEKQQEYEG